jgi:hypothetical protein
MMKMDLKVHHNRQYQLLLNKFVNNKSFIIDVFHEYVVSRVTLAPLLACCLPADCWAAGLLAALPPHQHDNNWEIDRLFLCIYSNEMPMNE